VEAATSVTVTERRWLTALAQDSTMVELAVAEGYSERHLRRMLADVYRRLGADGRVHAPVRTVTLGLLDDSSRTEDAGTSSVPE
jgi:DNA-binding CsgD family transcriptional regulator